MWFCMNDGFLSVVCDREHEGFYLVRARHRDHLKAFLPKKYHRNIAHTMENDYHYRVRMAKEEFAVLMHDRILNINYSNFKNSVVDDDLHDLYSEFWNLHFAYQWAQRRIKKGVQRVWNWWSGDGSPVQDWLKERERADDFRHQRAKS